MAKGDLRRSQLFDMQLPAMIHARAWAASDTEYDFIASQFAAQSIFMRITRYFFGSSRTLLTNSCAW